MFYSQIVLLIKQYIPKGTMDHAHYEEGKVIIRSHCTHSDDYEDLITFLAQWCGI